MPRSLPLRHCTCRHRRWPGVLPFRALTDLRNLLPGHRSAQVRHRPARLEHDRLRVVDVMEQEHPLTQCREDLFSLCPVETAAGGALEAIEDTGLVALRLQPSEEPR